MRRVESGECVREARESDYADWIAHGDEAVVGVVAEVVPPFQTTVEIPFELFQSVPLYMFDLILVREVNGREELVERRRATRLRTVQM